MFQQNRQQAIPDSVPIPSRQSHGFYISHHRSVALQHRYDMCRILGEPRIIYYYTPMY